jgi:ribosomal-protein-alanine N-acetyltransferase
MEIVKGERLYLKEIEISEIDDKVMSWFENDELMKYYTNSKNKISKTVLIDAILKGKEQGNVITYGIYTLSNVTLIGTIKLGPINFNQKTSDLVVLIGNKDYLGKGYSVDAIKLGNELAFKYYDLRKLYGGIYISNIPSIKAYRRAGWLVEGRLKGFYYSENKNEDRLLVGCFNPNYFTEQEMNEIKNNENRYISN